MYILLDVIQVLALENMPNDGVPMFHYFFYVRAHLFFSPNSSTALSVHLINAKL